MSTSSPVAVRHLRRAATLCDDGLTDAQLLDGFFVRREEAAFEALVRRHGPMVLGVCRRVVGNSADADDAFQATFLVLVRRAGSLRQRDLLANWLYGVAFRTALEARSRMIRRRSKEQPMADVPDPANDLDATSPELLALLDRELHQLPDKYRVPVVLCELQGTSRKDAARRLGIPEGTLSSRLAAARRRLAERLTRRGVLASATTVALALSQSDAPASVPSALVGSTVRAAANCAAGASVAAPVAAITQGVIKTMFLTKLKITAAVMVAVGLTAGTLGYGLFSSRPVAVAAAAPQDAKPGEGKPAPAKPKDQKPAADSLEGAWKVTESKPDKVFQNKDGLPYFFFGKEKAYIGTADKVEVEFKLTINAKAQPKQITLAVDGQDRKMEGIYKIEGDKATVAFVAKPNDPRPENFDAAATTVVFQLQRDPKAKMPDPKDVGNKIKIAAARQHSANNMKQIGLAIHNYASVNTDTLPAAAIVDKNGKPLLSWRVAILPYIEQDQLYKQFKLDEPWDSDHNKKLLAQMPKIYGDKGTTTHYRVFTGKGTMFEGTKGIKFTDVTDGTSNTLMTVEAVDDVEWTKPEEFEYDAAKPLPKLGGTPFENGFHIGMADGSVRFMSAKAAEKTIRAIITRNGGEVIDNKEEE